MDSITQNKKILRGINKMPVFSIMTKKTPMIFNADLKTTPDYITLSDNDLTATCTSASSGVAQTIVALRGKSAGKHYFEMEFDSVSGNKQDFIGILELPPSYSYPGKVNGASFQAYNARISKSDTSFFTDASLPTAGAIIGVAVDFTNLKAFWSLNNNWISFTSENSNPVTGVDPLYVLDSATVYYPSAAFYANTGVIKLIDPSSLTYTPPSGYEAW